MSFSFALVGTPAEIAEQIAHTSASGNKVGELAKQLVADTLSEPDDAPTASGYHPVYVVRASGHSGGGSPVSLNLTIEAHYVPDTGKAAAEDPF